MNPKDIRPARPQPGPVHISVPLAVIRERLVRQGMRFLARRLQDADFVTADDLTTALGKLPEGVDPRWPTSEAFKRLQRLRLMRREGAVLSSRRGGYTGLWRVRDRPGLAEWLKTNPPAADDPPVTRQLSLPI